MRFPAANPNLRVDNPGSAADPSPIRQLVLLGDTDKVTEATNVPGPIWDIGI